MKHDVRSEPPNNVEAEKAVIACCFLGDKSTIEKAATILRPDDFYARANRLIFAAILDLHLKGGGVDPRLILFELEARDHLKELGGRVLDETTRRVETGREYLASIVSDVESAANVESYCRLVREVAMKREAVQAAIEIELAGRNGHTGPEVAQQMRDHADRILAMFANTDGYDRFGVVTVNASDTTPWLIRGLIARRGITLIHGLPKAGKSTIVYAMIASLQRGAPMFCQLASPESCDALVLSEEDESVLGNTYLSLHVDPTRALAVTSDKAFPRRPFRDEIDALIKKCNANPSVGVVVIDTFRFWSRVENENDQKCISPIVEDLKRLASCGVAVVVVHHSNKAQGEDGVAASGSTALTGGVDIEIDIRRFGGAKSTLRTLHARGRYKRIPAETVVDYREATGEYVSMGDADEARDKQKGDRIASCLANSARWLTYEEIEQTVGMGKTALVESLRSLVATHAIQRVGKGARGSPFMYAANNVPIHHQPTQPPPS